MPEEAPVRVFGELLYEFRQKLGVSQRQLALTSGVTPSLISEVENGRRAPPCTKTVEALCDALALKTADRQRLTQIASEQRELLGTKVGRNTPVHVAELIRDIARLGHQLTDRQVATIRSNLTEARMK